MSKPIGFSVLSLVLLLSGLAPAALGVPAIEVGTIQLLPNMPNQVVELRVTGGDPVEGLNLWLMVANGGPELEALDLIPVGTGISGPRITNLDVLAGTLFAANNTGQQLTVGENGVFQIASASTTTAAGVVAADGLLARVTLDTTGLTTGTFAFSLSALGASTDFAGTAATLTDGVLVVGSGGTTPGNQTLAANAGPDQSVLAGTAVQLTGSGTHPQGATLTYHWRQINGPLVLLADPRSATTGFTAPADVVNTQLTFELSVSDGIIVATDAVTINVSQNELLFSVDAGPDQSVAAGALVQLNASITNPGGRILSLEWIQTAGPTAGLTGGAAANPTFLAPVGLTNTLLTFEVRAFDRAYEAVDTVSILVGSNQANLLADAGDDVQVEAGATVPLLGTVSDPAGAGASYLWVQIDGPAVALSSETVADPTFVAPSLTTPSRLEFEFRAASGIVMSIDTVVIYVTAAAASPAPDEDETEGDNPAEQADYQAPVQTQQSLFPGLDWSSATTIAVGIGLLILALLLLWIFLL